MTYAACGGEDNAICGRVMGERMRLEAGPPPCPVSGTADASTPLSSPLPLLTLGQTLRTSNALLT